MTTLTKERRDAIRAAVTAYDAARCAASGDKPMSEANRDHIAPMIESAITAYLSALGSEPVAWQFRDKRLAAGEWQDVPNSDFRYTLGLHPETYEVRPLYAAPLAPTPSEPVGYVDRLSLPTRISPSEQPEMEIPVFAAPPPAPAIPEGWKPIDEHTKTPALVCRFGDDDHNWLPMTAYRQTGGGWLRPASRDGLPYEPTHWQPLPAPLAAAPEAK